MSDAADLLAWQLKAVGGLLATFQREFHVIPKRRFRWDLAYPLASPPLAIEVQGYGRKGLKGGHQTFAGMRRDGEKSALAAIAGWRSMAVTSDQVRDGRALAWIQQAIT